jgi:hypothetical protein
LFLLALEGEELFLRFLDLRIEVFGADIFGFAQLQHLFHRADAIRHDLWFGDVTPGILSRCEKIATNFSAASQKPGAQTLA